MCVCLCVCVSVCVSVCVLFVALLVLNLCCIYHRTVLQLVKCIREAHVLISRRHLQRHTRNHLPLKENPSFYECETGCKTSPSCFHLRQQQQKLNSQKNPLRMSRMAFRSLPARRTYNVGTGVQTQRVAYACLHSNFLITRLVACHINSPTMRLLLFRRVTYSTHSATGA